MKLVTQTPEHPDQIIDELESLATANISRLRISAAYTTYSGLNLLHNRIITSIGEDRWNDIPKSLITSFDYCLTDPNALTKWLSFNNSELFIQNSNAVENNFRVSFAFHPKVYIFDDPDVKSVAVGSANLTERALTGNTETISTEQFSSPRFHEVDQLWLSLCHGSDECDYGLIEKYKQARAKNPPPPTPPPPPPAPNEDSLWTAIQENKINPMQYDQFWVDAGSMTTGGSNNQLEMPRGGGYFFGVMFDKYDTVNQDIPIGNIDIMSRTKRWDSKKLHWRGGHNKMVRLYLPTLAQGGFDYANTVVLFRRVGNAYELRVASASSDRANAWKQASKLKGTVYKVGQNTDRKCGLF